jgi:BirA family biotin operon repressor/biotin-[acetyl-CoA-carboxylase] ligase
MDEARRLVEQGQTTPFWIMARRQTRGRGRQGRAWSVLPGNFAGCCCLRLPVPLGQASLMSFATSLALAEMFASLAPGVPVSLKWPNDTLLNGRKAAGVLLESAASGKAETTLVIGIGINLAAAPPRAPEGWDPTSIADETGRAPTPDDALDHLGPALHGWTDRLLREGFAPLRAAWLARAARLGEKVTARLPGETVAGVFVDIDDSGALLLDVGGDARAIRAADVFFG